MTGSSSVPARISNYAYDYGALGRRTKTTLQDGSRWEYGYNDRSEVTAANRKDATDNIWYAQQNVTSTHDVDGNLTNDGRWVYTCDAENRLIQMETTIAATTTGHPYTKLVSKYDWQGHRIARAVWKGDFSGSSTFSSRLPPPK